MAVEPTRAELSARRKAAGVPVRLTSVQAVNWIAFRQPTAADLTGRAEFAAKWADPSPDGRKCPLARALHELAGGPPMYVPSPLPPEWAASSALRDIWSAAPLTFTETLDNARALVATSGRTAAELHREIVADLEAHAAKVVAYETAHAELYEAEHDGLIAGEGEGCERTVAGVDVIQLWPEVRQTGDGDVQPSRRRRGGLDYALRDAPLVIEGVARVRSGEIAWDVARDLAPRALGSSHADSKAKRLLGRIHACLEGRTPQ